MRRILLISCCCIHFLSALGGEANSAPQNPQVPSTPEGWYERAFEQSLQDEASEAVQSYLKALQIDPDMAEAHHGVGVLYYRMRDGVQAIFHLRAAGNIYKSRTDPQSRKNLLIINGNLEKAYRKFNLDPADFEEIESVKPVSPEERWKATGVGFYIGDKGYLLAPLYALEGSERIRVKSSGGKGTAVRRAQDFTVYDISVLKADRSETTPGQALILGDSAGLKIGDPVFTINYKKLGVGAGKGRVLKGTITALKAIQKDEKMFQIDLPVGEMSGGPLLNSKGEVVGMILSSSHAQKLFESDGRFIKGADYAIKSSYLRKLLSRAAGPDDFSSPGRAAEPSAKKGFEDRGGEWLSNFVTVEISAPLLR